MMELHRDHRHYSTWNLESIAQILQKQFPTHHIVVVRPSRIQMHTFCCYDNFVNCNSTGAPDHVITHSSLHHLELLLKNLSISVMESDKHQSVCGNGHAEDDDSLVSSTTTEDPTTSCAKNGTLQESSSSNGEQSSSSSLRKVSKVNPHFERGHLTFVGFSKGCVVLNQLLYEFHYMKVIVKCIIKISYYSSYQVTK